VQASIDRLGVKPNLLLIHNPYVTAQTPTTESIRAFWHELEKLKTPGRILEGVSLGVSNFRPQDLNAILDDEQTKFKPVVNQVEYHPYLLSHLQPVLDIQAKHGIRTAAYGPLTPVLRHPTGGPIKPILTRVAERIKKEHGADVDEKAVLLLWARAQGVITVTASGNPDNITKLAEYARLPSGLLKKEEVEEIANVGRTVHFRHYVRVSLSLIILTILTESHSLNIWRRTFQPPIFQMAQMVTSTNLPGLVEHRK
jgi:diketogulonate reductase-like aldo/keto reductase